MFAKNQVNTQKRLMKFLSAVKRSVVACMAGLLLFFSLPAICQISGAPPVKPGYSNATSLGLSTGRINGRDAEFWGWAIDYSKKLGGRWSTAASIMWDRETESFLDKPNKEVDSFTVAGTVSYSILHWLNAAGGVGKGFANTDNSNNTMKFTSGDWATGVSLVIGTPGFPFIPRDSIAISVNYEYNISANETSVSADLSVGWSF